MKDDLLFTIISVAATAGFVLGIISGFWPVLLASALIAAVLLWLPMRHSWITDRLSGIRFMTLIAGGPS